MSARRRYACLSILLDVIVRSQPKRKITHSRIGSFAYTIHITIKIAYGAEFALSFSYFVQ